MKEKDKFLKELRDSLEKLHTKKEYILVVQPQYYEEAEAYKKQFNIYDLDIVIREDLPGDVKGVIIDKHFFKNQTINYEDM